METQKTPNSQSNLEKEKWNWKNQAPWLQIVLQSYNQHCAAGTEGFPGGSVVKNLLAIHKTWVQSLGQEDPLEKEMATHSRILTWEISWTGEPGRHSWGSKRVRCYWAHRAYVKLTHFAVQQKLTQYCKSAIIKNIRPETVKLLEENINRTLFDITCSRSFLIHLLE